MDKPTHGMYIDVDGHLTVIRGIHESVVAVYSEGLAPVEQFLSITGVYVGTTNGRQSFLITIDGPARVILADGSKMDLPAGANVIVSTH